MNPQTLYDKLWSSHVVRQEPDGSGKGVALIVMDSGAVPVGRSEVRVHGDDSVTVLTGSAELGQGSRTVLAMIAAEELGLPLERVRIAQSDSGLTPYARTTGADHSPKPLLAMTSRT